MGAGDPPALTHRTDSLTRPDRIPRRYVGPAQMEVGRHQSLTVIEIDRLARQIEVGHQRYHAAAGGQHRRAHRSGEIRSQVAAFHFTVEYPGRAKGTCDPAVSG